MDEKETMINKHEYLIRFLDAISYLSKNCDFTLTNVSTIQETIFELQCMKLRENCVYDTYMFYPEIRTDDFDFYQKTNWLSELEFAIKRHEEVLQESKRIQELRKTAISKLTADERRAVGL
jgi:hypothetical protein